MQNVNPLQFKLTAMAEREAIKRARMQASSGCEHQDKANQRLLRIGYEDGHKALHGIVLELVEALEYIKEGCIDDADYKWKAKETLASVERKLGGV